MKKVLCAALALTSLTSLQAKTCHPAKELIDYPADIRGGQYFRFSPDGKQIIASSVYGSGGGNVAIMKIEEDEEGKKTAVTVPTYLSNEAYAVEGMRNKNRTYEWELISAPPSGRGPTKFYEANTGSDFDVVNKGTRADVLYTDRAHGQYYHSTAAFKGPDGSTDYFRNLLWRRNQIKDYKISRKADGSIKDIEPLTETYQICTNVGQMSGPIISKDTQHVSFSDGYGTVVYKINYETKECELVADLGYSTSKTSFAYPGQKKLGFEAHRLIESDRGVQSAQGVFVYDFDMENGKSEEERTTLVSDPSNESSDGYPGFLEDGRVIYIAHVEVVEDGYPERLTKIVIVDPKQLNSDGSVNKNATDCTEVGGKQNAGNLPKVPTVQRK